MTVCPLSRTRQRCDLQKWLTYQGLLLRLCLSFVCIIFFFLPRLPTWCPPPMQRVIECTWRKLLLNGKSVKGWGKGALFAGRPFQAEIRRAKYFCPFVLAETGCGFVKTTKPRLCVSASRENTVSMLLFQTDLKVSSESVLRLEN